MVRRAWPQGKRARLEPAPCAEPISEDGFHWGVAKR